MSHDKLSRLAKDIAPEMEQHARVRARMMKQIQMPSIMEEAKFQALPSVATRMHIWQRVASNIRSAKSEHALDHLKETLSPDYAKFDVIRQLVMSRLHPVAVPAQYRTYKWVAAFTVLAVFVRVSPWFFLAPQTVAESVVMLLPTRGEVSVSINGVSQTVNDDLALNEGATISTGEGEATISLHDDGNIRLAPHTTIVLTDLTDRPESTTAGSTFTLRTGQVWVQGLLPEHVRGIVAATDEGSVSIHAGSVSLISENGVTIQVWDRHALLAYGPADVSLSMGERLRISNGVSSGVQIMNEQAFTESWVARNLEKDAAHQKEIAALQRSRRAARAGILPTSPLYPVKRVAEKVDVLFTLDPDSKVQKKIHQATTRLNEAAALIANGTGADAQLMEYKESLLAIATGSGGDSLTQDLMRQEVTESTAALAAALPADDEYVLKRTVLEASAELPEDVRPLEQEDVKATMLVETLDSLQDAARDGDQEAAEELYSSLTESLTELQNESDVNPVLKKDARSLSASVEIALGLDSSESGSGTQISARPISIISSPKREYVSLTEQQIDTLVMRIVERINVYRTARGQDNQLHVELRKIQGHSDEGRILRALHDALEDQSLKKYVRAAMQQLQRRMEKSN